MNTLRQRPRRLRNHPQLRRMVREHHLTTADLIYPLFIVPGEHIREEISSLPGQYHLSADQAVEVAKEAFELGIPAVEVFGIPTYKDEDGSSAWQADQPVQAAVRAIRREVPDLYVITDVCMCQYTTTGHCGHVEDGCIINDATLPLLAKVAVSHAEAGSHMVAPSDMMDGRIAALREALDDAGFSDTAIMSYAAKYASAYYGPFRDAVNSAPQFGDRKTYQMDCANAREAAKEIATDITEGADIIMIKPALAYLDIVRAARESCDLPICVYNVSGEYAMVKAAAARGLIDERRLVLESLLSMKRAGADIIITYHALDAARWLKEGEC